MEKRERQEIDVEGKVRLAVALCEGKITGEMYELTMGESFAQSLKKQYQEAAGENRDRIMDRERRGLITQAERRFILGDGPEPKAGRERSIRAGNKKSGKEAALRQRNKQARGKRSAGVVAGWAVMGRGEAVKEILAAVKGYEEGSVSEGQLKAKLGLGYVKILKHLYELAMTKEKMAVMLMAKEARLSPEELKGLNKLFEERGEDDGGDETPGDGRDAEAGGGADGGGPAGRPEGVH